MKRKKGFDWHKRQPAPGQIKHTFVGNILLGVPDSNGDVFMPGCITFKRGEYAGLMREAPILHSVKMQYTDKEMQELRCAWASASWG
jgi:hypothetical protein